MSTKIKRFQGGNKEKETITTNWERSTSKTSEELNRLEERVWGNLVIGLNV